MPRQLGAIATGHTASAYAGAEMLADGGNAIDAAAAAAFASCTCEPTLTGLGGAGFATVHLADGTGLAIDFFASVPGVGRTVESVAGTVPVEVLFGSTTQTFHVGPQSCAVPGFVAGVLGMHERFGRLPRERVLEAGIRLAREGLVLTREQAYCHLLLENILVRKPTGRDMFAPGGEMLGAGDHFAQPGLATTMELLAEEGADCFYRGSLARQIVEWADSHDGLISAEDLARYRVVDHDPVRVPYRSLEFLSVPPPSSGGSLVAYALMLLDRVRGDGKVNVETGEGALQLVAAMIAANAARGAEFDSYVYGEGLEQWLLSDEQIERGLEVFRAAAGDRAMPSSRLGSTTHLSVIDGDGNAVSMTTSTGCGSGEFVADTGIHLNNMLGEEDLLPVEHQLVPGDRLTSMMAPSLLLMRGAPLLASGSAGSSRLRSAILQTILRIVESRYTTSGTTLQQRLTAATACARLHAEAGLVHAEPGYDESVIASIEAAGHQVNRWPMKNMYFGGVNMVAVTEDGSFASAADPRRGGGACVVDADGSVRAV